MKYCLVLAFCFALCGLWAQGPVGDKKKQAKELIYYEKYADALAVLTSSRQLIRDDEEAQLLLAICYYQNNQLEKARQYLTVLVEKPKISFPESLLYLAKVCHSQHLFEEASTYYKRYLRNIKNDHEHRRMVVEEIRRCANGLNWEFQTSPIVVENLGKQINTAFDEFAPIPSPNYLDRLYFSSARHGNAGGLRNRFGVPDERLGHYCSDIFTSSSNEGQWGDVSPLHQLINGPQHEVLLDFSSDGNVLYYFKGWTLSSGDIVVDTFKKMDERTISSTPFLAPINAIGGDGPFCLYQDSVVIFASRREGGFGGLDLYRSALRNGQWSPAENLGNTINSSFDETTPFLSRDGKTLYFSSNDSRKSVGGLDIFKSVYIESAQNWTEPYNLGLPVNSASDDAYFRISKDGFTAFFSSSRKDGFGQRDIYIAYFPNYLTEMEPPPVTSTASRPPTYEKPTTTNPPPVVNTKPQSDSKKTNPPKTNTTTTAKTEFGPVAFSNESDLLNSKNSAAYDKIAALMQQYNTLTLVITGYPNRHPEAADAVYSAVKNAEQVADYLIKKGVSPAAIFLRGVGATASKSSSQFVEFAFTGTRDLDIQGKVPVIGDHFNSAIPNLVTNKDLCYKIQIASSRGLYKSDAVKAYASLMVEKKYDFDYYRYTLGAFEHFAEADEYRKMLVKNGFDGSYVVPYINGMRADKDKVKQNVGIFPDLANYLGK